MRKRTRRKVWSTAINPIMHAVMGAALIPQEELDRLRIRELAAIEALGQRIRSRAAGVVVIT